MKLLKISTVFMIISAFLFATDGSEGKMTTLCMIGHPKDYISGGKNRVYTDEDGEFTFSMYGKAIDVSFMAYYGQNGYRDNWSLLFEAPEHKTPTVGVYKNATRCPFQAFHTPGLSVSGCGRGHNTLTGEFEILELNYGSDGKIESFAANFIQGADAPLLGSIRYNSSIPLEAKFSETFDLGSPVVILNMRNSTNNEKSQYVFSTKMDNSSAIEITPLPYGGEGVEIAIKGSQETWVFDFAAPIGREFTTGVYESLDRYPFHGHFTPGIEITTPAGTFKRPQGEFTVVNMHRDNAGKIDLLALNFTVQNENGEILEGSIRYKSPDFVINSNFTKAPECCYGSNIMINRYSGSSLNETDQDD